MKHGMGQIPNTMMLRAPQEIYHLAFSYTTQPSDSWYTKTHRGIFLVEHSASLYKLYCPIRKRNKPIRLCCLPWYKFRIPRSEVPCTTAAFI